MSLVVLPLIINGEKILKEGGRRLDSLGLKWWLSFGTLLGFHRDGGWIEGDTDVDVSVFGGPELFPSVEAAFSDWKPLRFMDYQRAYLVERTIFDIYFYQQHGDEFICRTENGDLIKPARLFTNMEHFEFNGLPYPAPSPIEEYLQICYGEDWKIPKNKKVDWIARQES
jgi:phosphorylcholine metabolism protein LicD